MDAVDVISVRIKAMFLLLFCLFETANRMSFVADVLKVLKHKNCVEWGIGCGGDFYRQTWNEDKKQEKVHCLFSRFLCFEDCY